jgi:hypothetical protein
MVEPAAAEEYNQQYMSRKTAFSSPRRREIGMDNHVRDTGIDVLGHVPWGTHFCQFYQTKQDLVGILVPYFKAGLEQNEFCMWVTAEPLNTGEAEAALREAVPDLEGRPCG